MPLFTETDETVIEPPVAKAEVPVPSITVPPLVTQTYRNESADTTLIMDIDGQPWTVEYYRQLLVSGESPKILDLGIDPTLQQYQRISAFRLSVTGDLSSSTEADTGTTTITGEGLIYPDTVIPHIGDMFIGKVEMGIDALFTITAINRMSLYKRTVYQIEYRVYAEATAQYREELDSKVAETLFFDKYRLMAGKSPLVTHTEANKEIFYKTTINRSIDLLYSKFFDTKVETFIYMENAGKCYDHWAIAFFNQVIGRKILANRSSPREYNLADGVKANDRHTLWRMILGADGHGIEYLYPRKFKLVYASTIGIDSFHSAIRHTDISVIPIPDDWNTVDIDLNSDAYVLSHNFYDKDLEAMTTLERVTWNVITRAGITDGSIETILNTIPALSGKELFHTLILIIAILNIRLTEGV